MTTNTISCCDLLEFDYPLYSNSPWHSTTVFLICTGAFAYANRNSIKLSPQCLKSLRNTPIILKIIFEHHSSYSSYSKKETPQVL